MAVLFMAFTLCLTFQLSAQIELQISYEASTNVYAAIPKELQLINVAVFTRHGRSSCIT